MEQSSRSHDFLLSACAIHHLKHSDPQSIHIKKKITILADFILYWLFLMPYVKQQWLLLIKVIVSIQETKYQESMKTFVHVLNLPRISRATEYI